MNKNLLWAVAIIAALTFTAVPPLVGQTATTGALGGVVTDPSGAVLPGTTVRVLDAASGSGRTVVTDDTGRYRAALLIPGQYTVEASLPGFKTRVMQGIVINVAETHTLDVSLELGEQRETITVTTDASVLQTETTTLGGVVGEETVANLPLSTRNYTQIVNLSPGVMSDVTNAGELGRNTTDVFVHGMRTTYNNYQMDGAEVNNQGSGRGGEFLGYGGIPVPNPDAIQEFKVQTSQYDAGYGKAVGANVNVVTKSGSNDFHGSLFWFFRNENLNANDFFLNRNNQPKPVLKQNQFGGTIGGPIVPDEWFFFGSYQRTRQINGIGARSLASSFLPPITDDRSAATLGSQFCGQSGAFGGVGVACDGSNISPVALKLLNVQLPNGTFFIPTPQTIQADGQGFSVFSIPSDFTEDQFLVNIDGQLTDSQKLSGRYFFSRTPQEIAFTTSNIPGSGANANFGNRNLVLRLQSTLSASFFNEFTFAFNRIVGDLQTATPVTAQEIGLTPGSDRVEIPTMDVEGLFSLGGNFNDNITTGINSFQLGEQVSWLMGKHSLRFGFNYERIQSNIDIPGIKRGAVVFLSFPDFLLGMSAAQNGSDFSNVFFSFGIGGTTDRAWRINNVSTWVQDNYQIHPRLTLNLGLRWEILGLPADDQGRITNFYPRLADNNIPPGGTFEGFVVASNFPSDQFPLPAGVGSTGNKSPVSDRHRLHNFGPRVGLAWQPWGQTSRFVIRAGYGVFYAQTAADNFEELLVQPPFLSFFAGEGVSNAAATFAKPFVPGPAPIPVWEARTATSQLTLSTFDEDFDSPIAQHYNVNIQYEFLRDLLLEVGYVGNHATRIVRGRQINQALLASPSNPIRGITSNTVANAAQRVPLLGFAPRGLNQRESRGAALYHGMELNLRKRFSRGLSFQLSYTLSKTLDEVVGTTGPGAAFTGSFSGDVRNLRQVRGPSEFDRRHRFIISYLWQLPDVRDRQGFLGRLLSDWQVSGVTTFQSGSALTIRDQRSGSIFGLFGQRAHLCPGATHDQIATSGSVHGRLDGFFNRGSLCDPPAIGDGFGFGELGRGVVRGPDQRNFDIAISRLFEMGMLGEDGRLEFRTEFFNAFNTPQFANPGTNVRFGDFGQITQTSVASRIIQFALKLSF